MKRTNIFLSWVKNRSGSIFLYLAASLIALGVFILYRLPSEPIIYIYALSTVILISVGTYDFIMFKDKHKKMLKLENEITYNISNLPAAGTLIEADYQELIRRLFDECASIQARSDASVSDMTDFYTLWAHQIKTPISAMRLLIQSGEASEADITAELFKIEQYVEMVLSYLRIGSESNDFIIRRYDLDGIVKQAVKKYARLFIAKKISLNYTPCEIEVLTDEKWLQFTIEQILSNALKYTKEGSISVYTEGHSLVIEDTGIGISDEDLPRVFEKGYTGYNGHEDKKSTGIGLYLCKKALNKLGHTIEIRSKVGAGTKVIIGLQINEVEIE